MSILLNESTVSFSTEPLVFVIAIVAFATLVFLGIRGKLRDWMMR